MAAQVALVGLRHLTRASPSARVVCVVLRRGCVRVRVRVRVRLRLRLRLRLGLRLRLRLRLRCTGLGRGEATLGGKAVVLPLRRLG